MIRQFNGLSQENRLFFVLARIGAYTGAHPETPGGKGRQAKGGEPEGGEEAKGERRKGEGARGGAERRPRTQGGEPPNGTHENKKETQCKNTISKLGKHLSRPSIANIVPNSPSQI